MRLAGKVALITGGGTGIGRACVELFAAEGASIVIASRDADVGTAVQDEIRARGQKCLFVKTDVGEADQVKDAVDQTIQTFGSLDILYNNAGGSTAQDGPVDAIEFDEFWNKMRVDLFGTWLGCHYAIPHMRKAGRGSIINSSSICAIIGTAGRDAYTAAKGAITSLTRSMAVEYAPDNIRVNAIAAGVTATERVAARLAVPGNSAEVAKGCLLGVNLPIDIANAVLYLASDESLRTTGHVMVVDSGLTIT
jgi:NAD(P)-dependent dehydrogenase (short-subunit alcohol dehydrogenase family)